MENNNNTDKINDIIIEVKGLKKVFKIPKKSKDISKWKKRLSWFYREWEDKIAVDKINLKITRGEILAYIGPNGAGKSTTIKMLTGILHPSKGDIKIYLDENENSTIKSIIRKPLNPIQNRNEYTQEIGVVFGQRSILAYDIPVKDSFRLFKAIYGLSEEFYQERVKYLVEILEIEKFFETPYRMLSLGEKMRCELAASFLHKPKIVFLDEPTIGLDATAKITIRSFLKKINKEENVTIMITTHDMDDIEELCERIVLIDEGMIAYEGGINKFKEKYANSKEVELYFKEIKNEKKLNILKDKYEHQSLNEYNLIFEFPMNQSLGHFLSELVSCVEIIDLSIHEAKLEDIVANMYKSQKSKKLMTSNNTNK